MARSNVAQTQNTGRDGTSDARGVRVRRSLLGSLPLAVLLALMALLIMPATATATGAGPGISVSPPQGGVGTRVTLNGTRFPSGDQITIGYSNGSCASGVTTISGAGGAVGSDGSFSFSFQWPQTDKGAYTVCATDTNSGTTYPSGNKFTVTDSNPPSITISGPVAAGQPVTVTGAHFVATQPGTPPGTVQILYGASGSNGCGTVAGHTTINNDGSFTFTFNAPFVTSDTTFVVTAVVPEGSCGGSPTLQAQGNLNVTGGATATVTPAATPSPAAVVATPGETRPGLAADVAAEWPMGSRLLPRWPAVAAIAVAAPAVAGAPPSRRRSGHCPGK